LIDPALPEITTASPLLHHSLGHDPICNDNSAESLRRSTAIRRCVAKRYNGDCTIDGQPFVDSRKSIVNRARKIDRSPRAPRPNGG